MRDIPSGSDNRPVARSGPRRAVPAHARAKAQRAHEHRRAVIVTCGVLLAAVAAAAAVIGTGSPLSLHLSNLPQTAAAPLEKDVHNATITTASEGKGCSQQTFDNQTGRFTRSQQPCDATAYDSNGVPIDPAVVHRLDALRKSFSTH